MAIINPSGLQPGWCVGHVPPHPLTATLIVKGTFRLAPGGTADPAPEQDGLGGDAHEEGDPAKSLRYASDFAWIKPNADVMLVGTCHPPGGRPQPVCRVRRLVETTGRHRRTHPHHAPAPLPEDHRSRPVRGDEALLRAELRRQAI